MRNLRRHITSMRQAIETIQVRLTVEVGASVKVAGQRKPVRGYATQGERFAKQRRLQHLKAELVRAEDRLASGKVSIVEGGRRLAKTRHNLQAADMSEDQWRREWARERTWFTANGSTDEGWSNATITITTDGTVSLRLPAALEHLANGPRGRFTLNAKATFAHRGEEWAARIAGNVNERQAVSYRMTPHQKGGWQITASWSLADEWVRQATAPHRPFGLDLNADHVAGWVLDTHGNPVGAPIDFPATWDGLTTGERDALVRQVVARIIHTAISRDADAIIIEDLDFADARTTGRETMGRGNKGKKFRKTVAGMPTAKFRNYLQAAAHNAGLRLIAVNPAYTSQWGDQHWKKPTSTPTRATTRHQAAAVVIARRGLGHKARRQAGVTEPHQSDGQRRATAGSPSPTRPRTTRPRQRTQGNTPGPASPLARPNRRRKRERQARQPLPWPKLDSNGQLKR
jgi:IS605 OrfB family transposase